MLDEFRPRMRELVQNAGNVHHLIPQWRPKGMEETLADHIHKLAIPSVGDKPSLLLHNLGELNDDLHSSRFERITDIFSVERHSIIINTSGSGKTRLLLDGLCHHWGFYFVGAKGVDGIGSEDLSKFFTELNIAEDYDHANEARKKDRGNDAAFKHMQNVVHRRLSQLLLARFLLLNLLMEEARNTGGLKLEQHRRLWVLLQVQPERFGPMLKLKEDIFLTVARELRYTSKENLQDRIFQQYVRFRTLDIADTPNIDQDGRFTPIFCILDEVQVTSDLRLGEFISTGPEKKARPILREIWLLWTTVLLQSQMRIILAGTGVKFHVIRETLASSTNKAAPWSIKHDIGAFDDPSIQAEYIKSYIKASWTEPNWKEFLIRAFGWCRGRYRSTATLILLLLQGGYRNPHRTLNAFVEFFTHFKPTDADRLVNEEPMFPSDFDMREWATPLNLDKLSDTQMKTIAKVIYDHVLHGRYSLGPFSTEERDNFVEYGFARHKVGSNETVIDEPMYILAATWWINQHASLCMAEWFRDNIKKHSHRENGFEAYLSYYIRKVFESGPELDAVFKFRADFARRAKLDWLHHSFELVSVSRGRDPPETHVSVVTPFSGASSNVGFPAKSGEDVLRWISTNKEQFIFCFPPERMGPDLLFFLRSKISQSLLLVVVQAKAYDNIDKNTLIHGVRTVTPSWFWRSRDSKHFDADTSPFLDEDSAREFKEVLAELPNPWQVDGAEYPILRVFASWPASSNIERTMARKTTPRTGKTSEDSPLEDNDDHLLASLHEENFKEFGQQLAKQWFEGDIEQRTVIGVKRDRELDIESKEVAKRRKV
ncbi:hypothetical protein CPB86DRAFT_421879 [Serendipita vermifera]|nr:hypothetical protein CPB86DRAFT_421879 [Serendipita vermifera]